ncbi:MAG: hypothetical protein VX668_10985, partial [Planctomycetota bacterium]|nr:hypothetical protein [Planctomycetota bacterium]
FIKANGVVRCKNWGNRSLLQKSDENQWSAFHALIAVTYFKLNPAAEACNVAAPVAKGNSWSRQILCPAWLRMP